MVCCCKQGDFRQFQQGMNDRSMKCKIEVKSIENIGKRLENGLLSENKLSIIIVKSYRKIGYDFIHD